MAARKKASSSGLSPEAELIDLIIDRAPRLRAAGVTSLSVGTFSVMLDPPPPPEPVELDAPKAPPQHIDPLRDPATFPGGLVPGFRRETERGGAVEVFTGVNY